MVATHAGECFSETRDIYMRCSNSERVNTRTRVLRCMRYARRLCV